MSVKKASTAFFTTKSPGRERPMETCATLCASVVRRLADNSTLAAREVFSATYTPSPKMIPVPFAPIGAKLCEAFTSCNPAREIRAGFIHSIWFFSSAAISSADSVIPLANHSSIQPYIPELRKARV